MRLPARNDPLSQEALDELTWSCEWLRAGLGGRPQVVFLKGLHAPENLALFFVHFEHDHLSLSVSNHHRLQHCVERECELALQSGTGVAGQTMGVQDHATYIQTKFESRRQEKNFERNDS